MATTSKVTTVGGKRVLSGSNAAKRAASSTPSPSKTSSSSSGSANFNTSASNMALAQQAVGKGYVKSVNEYLNAEAAGKEGAASGYTNKGTATAPNYVANNFTPNPTIGIKDMTQDVVAPTLPTPAPTPNYNSTIESTNTALGLNADGTPKTKALSTSEALMQSIGITPPSAPESGADAYLKAQNELQIKEKQQAVNNYQQQLNAIVAKSQADQLRVEGQGRGIPEAIIGGQQAQISKEAAIQALPIQAQLSAAQGNLEMAQKTLDTWYQIKQQDIQNTYNYKMKLYDVAVSIADKAQQNAIEDRRQQAQFKQQRDMAYLDYDLAVKKASLGGGTKRDTSWQDLGNGQKVLVDNQTGEVISNAGGGKVFDASLEPLKQKLNLLNTAIGQVKNSGAVGTNPLARTSLTSWATGSRQAFQGNIKQLTSQETLDSLLNLKKAGGTLGALSDQERIMLQQAATKIGGWEIRDKQGNGTGFYNVSEKDFKNELTRLQDLTKKAIINADPTYGLNDLDLTEIQNITGGSTTASFNPSKYY